MIFQKHSFYVPGGNMEIERKYLLKKLPENLNTYTSKKLVQGYLSTEPVVRVRQEGDDFYLTYKSKGLLVREEANLPLNKESFEHLVKKADGIVIEKTRYFIPLIGSATSAPGTKPKCDDSGHFIHSGSLAELDVFHGELDGLLLVEVEFDSIEQANEFVAPDWFGEDVSESGLYQNSRLSREGLPK